MTLVCHCFSPSDNVFQNIAQAGKNFNSFLKFPKQSSQLCTSQIGQIKCKKILRQAALGRGSLPREEMKREAIDSKTIWEEIGLDRSRVPFPADALARGIRRKESIDQEVVSFD
ncbi:MAG: hypothetical protein IIZ00_05200 [Oscillospiraceae bacterium]|nr:hypothetical protein [Oscillospiraceae bacterium]